MVSGTIEQQLECDILRCRADRGDTVACWSIVAVSLIDRRGSEAMTIKRNIVGYHGVTCRVLVQPLGFLGCCLRDLLRARGPWRVMG